MLHPDRGQGFNNAVQDAAHYVEAMKKVRDGQAMEDVMAAYDQEVLERGKREISISSTQSIASHNIGLFSSGPLATMGFKQKAEVDN